MKNKKKIGIAALVATLSAAFICSSLTPTFAAAADTNTNSTVSILLSSELDAPAPCRLNAPDLDFACRTSADCLHQHQQVI